MFEAYKRCKQLINIDEGDAHSAQISFILHNSSFQSNIFSFIGYEYCDVFFLERSIIWTVHIAWKHQPSNSTVHDNLFFAAPICIIVRTSSETWGRDNQESSFKGMVYCGLYNTPLFVHAFIYPSAPVYVQLRSYGKESPCVIFITLCSMYLSIVIKFCACIYVSMRAYKRLSWLLYFHRVFHTFCEVKYTEVLLTEVKIYRDVP